MATGRLLLRPTGPADARRAFEIQSDWNVSRMLRAAAWPPDRAELTAWFADHARQWRSAEAYRFAILHEERLVGLCDLDEIEGGEGELGYWLEPAVWGLGVASEAARAVVGFAFDDAALIGLRSGHAVDNPASGAVLEKLGFRAEGEVQIWSRPRGRAIIQRRYALASGAQK